MNLELVPPKTCVKCQGDLAADYGDWLCLQCGTYYYTGLYQAHAPIDTTAEGPQSPRPATPDDSGQKSLGAGQPDLVAVVAVVSL